MKIRPYHLGSGTASKALREAFAILAVNRPGYVIEPAIQLGRETRIDDEVLAGEKRPGAGSEEDGDAGDVVRLPHASQRRLGDPPVARRRAVLRAPRRRNPRRALRLLAARRDQLVPRQLAVHPVPVAGGARARAVATVALRG